VYSVIVGVVAVEEEVEGITISFSLFHKKRIGVKGLQEGQRTRPTTFMDLKPFSSHSALLTRQRIL
jgi:hypothetical protein